MAEKQTYTLAFGMTCDGCANQARKVLGKLGDAVEIKNIDVEGKRITVESTLSADAVLEQLRKTGKECSLIA